MSEGGFSYSETDAVVRCSYSDGAWSAPYCTKDKFISLHVCSTCFHYGQSIFEGLKVLRGIDGKVRVFRWQDHAERMAQSALATFMPPVPKLLFFECLNLLIKANIEYVPTYESGASLYVRPLLIGTSPKLGVGPGENYDFIMFASPIGKYYNRLKNTFVIVRSVDRAAPLGLGQYKVAGNYATSFRATVPAHQQGFDCIFLDAKHKRYIEECSAANFIGIRDNDYVTPKSDAILPSVTNDSLMQLAKVNGIKVKRKKIPVTELSFFSEVAACGTASSVSMIDEILDPLKNMRYAYNGHRKGILKTLLNQMLDIQYGRVEDNHGWCYIIEE